MGKLRPNEILERVKTEGFESVWQESTRLIPKPTRRIELTAAIRGVSHLLFDLIQIMRQSFLDLGFMEVSNPIIVDETEVYKQYGLEASVILDRCYYLATLPRPEIGLSKAKCQEIERCGVPLYKEKLVALQKVLRDHKRGEIDADDLVEKIADSLHISYSMAALVLSEVFPEFASLNPEPSTLTLRSHITSSWFITLQALQHKLELPMKLFSVDVRFRRESKEDPLHLRTHHAASCIVMDDEVDVRDGKEITEAVLKPLGFKRFRFIQKKATSNYYTPETEYEGYIFHPSMKKWIEIVNYGLYSPIALARYNLEYPVLNVGIGVERVAMALHGETDVRRLVYPQFYIEPKLSDAEIAKMVKINLEPQTELGLKIRNKIESTLLNHIDALGPCQFLAYEGKILEKKVKVYVYETDVGAKLLGSAALNHIYVYDGNILGAPKKGTERVTIMEKALKDGVPVGLSYLHAVASLAASKIEKTTQSGLKDVNVRIGMAKHPSDVNIKISDVARRYITDKRKKIEISGPVFIGVRAEFAS